MPENTRGVKAALGHGMACPAGCRGSAPLIWGHDAVKATAVDRMRRCRAPPRRSESPVGAAAAVVVALALAIARGRGGAEPRRGAGWSAARRAVGWRHRRDRALRLFARSACDYMAEPGRCAPAGSGALRDLPAGARARDPGALRRAAAARARQVRGRGDGAGAGAGRAPRSARSAGALAYGLLLRTSRAALIGAYPAVYGLIGPTPSASGCGIGRRRREPARAFRMIGVLLGLQLVFGVAVRRRNDWIADLGGVRAGFGSAAGGAGGAAAPLARRAAARPPRRLPERRLLRPASGAARRGGPRGAPRPMASAAPK